VPTAATPGGFSSVTIGMRTLVLDHSGTQVGRHGEV
jgi:hypothetical protein